MFCTFKARMGLYRGMCGLVPSRVSLVKKRSETSSLCQKSSLRRCLTTDRSSVCMPARTHTHTHTWHTHTQTRTHTHTHTHTYIFSSMMQSHSEVHGAWPLPMMPCPDGPRIDDASSAKKLKSPPLRSLLSNACSSIDLMHWRHVSITTTPCWGSSRLVALRAHVLLAERIGAHPLSHCAHPGQLGGEACQGFALWLHAWRWCTWRASFDPQHHGGALLWRHMHMVY